MNSKLRFWVAALWAGAAASLASGQVVINELYYDAPSSDDGQTFVEVYGPAGTDVSGWTIQAKEEDGTDNNESFTFPAGTFLPADGILVVADEEGSTGTTQVANADFIVNDMDPENGADGMHLLDSTGALVDALAYGPVATPVGEGTPARDVFAPLSLERCPGGADTDDNFTDFTPNVATPGLESPTCRAIEWVSLGFGNSISCSAGESVQLDYWLTGSPNETGVLLLSCSPGPGGLLPVPWDICTTITFPLTFTSTPPFTNWNTTLGPSGEVVGTAFLDFSTFAGTCPGVSFDVYVGAISVPSLEITNCVMLTIDP